MKKKTKTKTKKGLRLRRRKGRTVVETYPGAFLGGHTWKEERAPPSVTWYDNSEECRCMHGRWYHHHMTGRCDFIHCGCRKFIKDKSRKYPVFKRGKKRGK